jgi:biotin transport system ATP-binding protein
VGEGRLSESTKHADGSPEIPRGLVVRNLSFCFPDGTQALKDISLSLVPGMKGLVAGPNGAGKTVLGRLIAGLMQAGSGSVLVDGCPPGFGVKGESPVGLVFQNPEHQIVGQTVWEDVLFGPENLGVSADEAAARGREALEAMGLSDRREDDPFVLSGGEKRRLAIAGVLAMRPRLLFLDEPFSGLDFPSLKNLLRALESPALRDLPILVATHEIGTFLSKTDRLFVLRRGELLYDGPPAPAVDRFEEWDLRPIGEL